MTQLSERTGPAFTHLEPTGRIGIRHFAPTIVLAGHPGPDAAWRIDTDTEQPEAGVLTARATVTNIGETPLQIARLRWQGISNHADGAPLLFPRELHPRYAATENFRGDFYGLGTTFGDRFWYPLSNQNIELGWSEDHLFPGLFIGAATEALGFLIAQASQDRFYPVFRLKGSTNATQWQFEIDEVPAGVPCLTLAPGESLAGEKLFFQHCDVRDVQAATDAYFRLLHRDGHFARRQLNPLPEQRIYCSWNYDFFRDITEADLLAQIPIVKEHFPSVRFIQLDDGYQHYHAEQGRAMIDLCYKLDEPFNRERFPSGPKGLADQVKAAGLRPAIWLGLWGSMQSPMFREHPDWVLHDESGRPLQAERTYGGTFVLDPSVPEVQAYLAKVARTVFGEWGYEGVKLDFSSFAFNNKRVQYRYPGKTGVEYRHLIETIFRRYLPDDGFFGWCVVAGTSQVFLSQADYFRNAIDIGHGDWKMAKLIANMTANTVLFLREWPTIPNIDSIGWSARFDETQWESWLTLCAVSGMAVELSGDLRKLDARRLQKLNRTLELSDPNRILRILDLPEGKVERPPALWLSEGDGDCLLAIINWEDNDCTIPLDDPCLTACRGPVTDAWTGASAFDQGLPTELQLPPRAARLLKL